MGDNATQLNELLLSSIMGIWDDRLYHLSITRVLTITAFGVGAIGFPLQALAQSNIVPDETLPENERSQVTPNFNGTANEVITGGATRGRNLFHSFREFNIDAGRGAYFFSPEGIANILSRVTGGNPSEINGVLGTFGIDGSGNFIGSNANLFLINPNGIVFGPSARLDINGSFVATTADSIQFGEAGFFSATNPEAPSQLLTVNPSAFFFSQLNPPAPIINQSVVSTTNPNFIDGLRVNDGRSLLLLGGEIQLLQQSKLFASSGRVELGAVTRGTVGLTIGGNTLDLTFPSNLQLGNILLTGDFLVVPAVLVDASGIQNAGTVGGEIQLQGNQIILTNASIQSSNYSSQANGAISLQANQLNLINSRVGTNAAANGNGGDIRVNANTINLQDRNGIYTSSQAQGDAGSIDIQATDTITLTNGVNVGSLFIGLTSSTEQGSSGDISITSRNFNVQNSGVLVSSFLGQGENGNITVQIEDSINLDGGTLSTSSYGASSSGDIHIDTGDLTIANSSGISSGSVDPINLNTVTLDPRTYTPEFVTIIQPLLANLEPGSYGQGDSGNITINARGAIRALSGSTINTSTLGQGQGGSLNVTAVSIEIDGISTTGFSTNLSSTTQGSGNAGDVSVNTEQLRITGGSAISTSALENSSGQGGDITVAADLIELNGTTLNGRFSSSLSSATQGTGDAGNVVINAGQLRVTGGANISTSAFLNSSGQAGNITVTADSIELDGTTLNGQFSSGMFSSTQDKGNAGDISVTTEELHISNGATISTSAEANSTGQGGDLSVTANSIELDGTVPSGQLSSSLSSTTQGVGNAGSVIVNTEQLRITGGAAISTSAFAGSSGQAGNITVTANSIALDGTSFNELARSSISSETIGSGDAGTVAIATDQLQVTRGAGISTSTFSSTDGRAGNLNIVADSIELDGTSSNGLTSGLFSSTQGLGNAGDISINTEQLRVTDRAAISTSTAVNSTGQGGDITLRATDSIELSGASADGRVASGLFSDTQGAGNAGNILITTGELQARDGAFVSTRSLGSGRGGNLTVNATDSIELIGTSDNEQSSSGLFSLTTGIGRAGNLRVETGELRIRGGAGISASTLNAGRGGNIRVFAETIDLSGTSANRLALSSIASDAFSLIENAGDAGTINIVAEQLRIRNGAVISTRTFGQGDAGDITVQVQDSTTLTNQGFISSSVEAGANGDGGNITLETGSLSATEGGQIAAVVSRGRQDQQGNLIRGGQGQGGSIEINASDAIVLTGSNSRGFSSGILTLSERGANGSAGAIALRTSDFRIADGAIVTASTFNAGQGGSIEINAENFEAIDGGQIVTSTRGQSRAGTITLNVTGDVLLSGRDQNFQSRRDRARRYANQSGQSDRASDVIVNQGSSSGLFANTENNSVGDGGSIAVNAENIFLTDQATISAQSQGDGNAGNINLNLTGTVNAIDSDIITSTSSQNASGGDITLSASNVQLFGDSNIRTDVQGQGGGGNITIAADYAIAFDDSDVLAYSVSGTGGNIVLPAFFGENYFDENDRSENESPSRAELNELDQNGQVNVDASGQVGSGTITTPDTSLIQNSLTDLPESAIDTENLLANSCIAQSESSGTFTITGAEGLPQRPGDAILPTYPTGTVRSVPDEGSDATSDHPWQMGDPIVEPQGAYQLADGRWVLSRECSSP